MNGAIVGYRVFYIHQNQTYFATLRSGTEAGEQITYVLSDLSKCFVHTIYLYVITNKLSYDSERTDSHSYSTYDRMKERDKRRDGKNEKKKMKSII